MRAFLAKMAMTVVARVVAKGKLIRDVRALDQTWLKNAITLAKSFNPYVLIVNKTPWTDNLILAANRPGSMFAIRYVILRYLPKVAIHLGLGKPIGVRPWVGRVDTTERLVLMCWVLLLNHNRTWVCGDVAVIRTSKHKFKGASQWQRSFLILICIRR